MKKQLRIYHYGLSVSFLTSMLTACLSMQNQTSLDGSQSTQPVVEAYFEYPGPHSRWKGPDSFVVHVKAKEGNYAEISTQPELLAPSMTTEPMLAPHSARTPAQSHLGIAQKTAATVQAEKPALSVEDTRQLLTQFAEASAVTPQSAAKGCLSPVRVRLIRADGSLTERQTCRAEGVVSRLTSETVHTLLSSTYQGKRSIASTGVMKAADALKSVPSPHQVVNEKSAPQETEITEEIEGL